ncbi:Glycosyl transferase [Candidatus Methylobacter favarea]|uniref:Glycosyl transferase n=1 Tax=Candidatus Methylobacter favarea TaxID=2707345 RepID=A0A8S0YAL3_9GAMM|nr:glycosyltransferase family 1 protein [Candidatus Methylobacter favarea]CAA9892157.1 Glycosyl transferase [Candidatus Methylobacter favarea]
MTLRIAFISDAWHPQINGVVTTIENTCSTLERAGHQIKLITPDQFITIPCPTYPSIRLAYACNRKLKRLLNEFNPQRIHIATEGPLGIAARRYCLNRKLAFTTSFHTLFAEYVNLRFKIPVSWGYGFLRWFHAPAKKIMVATSSVESDLKARGFKNTLVRWSRGVNSDFYYPRDKTFISLPRPVCMFVGRVAIEKNIDAFLSLELAGTKIVVGDGPQLKELKARFPDTVFAGFQTGEPLANYMAAADVFVFPSRTDTFGIVMLEALASGLPVAAFPVNGPVDVIGSDKVGRLDENLKKAIAEALQLDAQDCRNYALNYSWANCTRQFFYNLVPAFEKSRDSKNNSIVEHWVK